MAEAIQKKLKAELEKHTQMQKGRFYQSRFLFSHSLSCHVVSELTLTDHIRTLYSKMNGTTLYFPLIRIITWGCCNVSLYNFNDFKQTLTITCVCVSVCLSDVSKSVSARQKLESQLTENNIVKEVITSLFVISALVLYDVFGITDVIPLCVSI